MARRVSTITAIGAGLLLSVATFAQQAPEKPQKPGAGRHTDVHSRHDEAVSRALSGHEHIGRHNPGHHQRREAIKRSREDACGAQIEKPLAEMKDHMGMHEDDGYDEDAHRQMSHRRA